MRTSRLRRLGAVDDAILKEPATSPNANADAPWWAILFMFGGTMAALACGRPRRLAEACKVER